MPQYKAPLRDMRFLMNEVLDYPAHYQALGASEATPDMVEAILSECARLCEDVIAPLNQKGDAEGCSLVDGQVSTPAGFKDAYRQFIEGGWQGLSHPEAYGGQGMPMSMGVFKTEMLGSANWSFNMYPGLSLGAMNTILVHGDEQQKETYLCPLTEGRWSGTMCLTEPQCGTDLAQVSTKAEPQADGSYKLTGTKIFISAGDHDLTENIVHIALARLPGAPAGTRGISLFIVPKFLPAEGGGVGEYNNVVCTGIEHKMGIKGSATCVIDFEESTGFMIGPENKGLESMFTFMNSARIGTAVQGIAATELSYQGALAYAKERRSMRSLSGKKEPEQVADAIHHHADVRRMLLTMKAVAEGGRAMLYYASQYADKMTAAAEKGDDAGRQYWDDELGFYTPILKGFLTEIGNECANLGMQVFGGHGYIKEHGMEQIVRDTRIATLYEGTTGIQALDLLGRKILIMTKGKAVQNFTAKMIRLSAKLAGDKRTLPIAFKLSKVAAQWNYLTLRVALAARKDRDSVGAAAVDFLMFSGYAMLAHFWALMASVAYEKLDSGSGAETEEFYRAKIQTAEFYFDRLLPRAQAHADNVLASPKTLMQMRIEHFAFE